jgi:hypothetical protein
MRTRFLKLLDIFSAFICLFLHLHFSEELLMRLDLRFASPDTFGSMSALRGKPVEQEYVKDVGLYFPFLNREHELEQLWHRIEDQFTWEEQFRGKTDAQKQDGAQFIVCCGASGIGKTTFSSDGLRAFVTRSFFDKNKPGVLFQDCLNRNLTFRFSFIQVELQPQEIERPAIVLPYRILHQYTSTTRESYGYQNFLAKYLPEFGTGLNLQCVLDWIASTGKKQEQLVVIHIDETQELGLKDGIQPNTNGLFYQIIRSLWGIRNNPNSSTHLFPILSGTNALNLYDQFVSSGYKFWPLNLPLLSQTHLAEIAKSITLNASLLDENSLLVQAMHIATEGHPRLQKAFISVGSCMYMPINKSDQKNIVQHPFYKVGYENMLKNQHDPKLIWEVIRKTACEVEFDQFPEQLKIQGAGGK